MWKLFFLTACTMWMLCGFAGASEDDAKAIMRGVENARHDSPPFKAVYDLKQTRGGESRETEIGIEYHEGKSRITLSQGNKKSCVILNGTELMEYDGANSAVVTSPAKPGTVFGFDARVIGMTPLYAPTMTFDDELAYRSARSIDAVKQIEGNKELPTTWRINMVDQFQQVVRFDVQPSLGFRVLRHEVVVMDENVAITTDVSESRFEAPSKLEWLPSHVLLTNYDQDQRVIGRMEFSMKQCDVDVKLASDTFSLRGLGLPVGQPVADLRIKQRIGYWDGTGLSENLDPRSASQPPVALEAKSSTSYLLIVSINIIVFVVVVIAIIQFRRASQRRS